MEENEGPICVSGMIKWYQREAGCTDYLVVGGEPVFRGGGTL